MGAQEQRVQQPDEGDNAPEPDQADLHVATLRSHAPARTAAASVTVPQRDVARHVAVGCSACSAGEPDGHQQVSVLLGVLAARLTLNLIGALAHTGQVGTT